MFAAFRRVDGPPRARIPAIALAAWAFAACYLLGLPDPAVAVDGYPEAPGQELPARYRSWLVEVEPLITGEERRVFLAIETDYFRDAFIERFWRERDPYRDTARNELRERWQSRVSEARLLYRTLRDDRARMVLLNGRPAARCREITGAGELWVYDGSDRVRERFNALFVRRRPDRVYRLWTPGSDEFAADDLVYPGREDRTAKLCPTGLVERFMASAEARASGDYVGSVQRAMSSPDPPSEEWVLTFETYSTAVPEGAERFEAEVQLAFPGRHQSRTVLEAVLGVPSNAASVLGVGGRSSFNFLLTGEVVRGDRLFENFRYRFDLPVGLAEDGEVPLVFQRYLRPGEYRLVIKVEDLNAGTFFRSAREVEVPRLEGGAEVVPLTAASERLLEEATAAVERGERRLEIVPPPTELVTGLVRFEVRVLGEDLDKVAFLLDGREILSRRRPPYNVELDLGELPRVRRLRVEGRDDAGRVLASDELLVNANPHRFALRLVEPRPGVRYERSLRAEVEVDAPEGRVVERVELYLNEERVATLHQGPFVQPLVLERDQPLSWVRAVAYLSDGSSAEDVVVINAPEQLEEIDVEMVELFTTVVDRSGRPVQGLERGDFRILEDGVEQQLVRFERVVDLPFHAAILLDSSASMGDRMEMAKEAALEFLERTVSERDRAAILPFHDQPWVAVPFTNDADELARGLVGIQPERGTALFDSVVYGLYYFNGIRGQRALLVLSDGKDEHSRFTFEQTLDFARRAGVTLYTMGLDLVAGELKARRQLTRLAEETGGRSFFVRGAEELPGIYAEIEQELRSRYLLVYQSSNPAGAEEFRTLEVRVGGSGLEARTLRGYYP